MARKPKDPTFKAWEQQFRRKVLAEDGLVDRLEAAEMMGVTDRTLLRWHREGKGPERIYSGRSVYYRMADIDAWPRGSGQQCAGGPDPIPATV
jgi:predicted DNA-binding transcriptional regulator AlpA